MLGELDRLSVAGRADRETESRQCGPDDWQMPEYETEDEEDDDRYDRVSLAAGEEAGEGQLESNELAARPSQRLDVLASPLTFRWFGTIRGLVARLLISCSDDWRRSCDLRRRVEGREEDEGELTSAKSELELVAYDDGGGWL